MRFLLDANIDARAGRALAAAGHDVLSVLELDPAMSDLEILGLAFGQQRVLITRDKDFGELAVVHLVQHSGIVRISTYKGSHEALVCEWVAAEYSTELKAGALITVGPGFVRVRLDPGSPAE